MPPRDPTLPPIPRLPRGGPGQLLWNARAERERQHLEELAAGDVASILRQLREWNGAVGLSHRALAQLSGANPSLTLAFVPRRARGRDAVEVLVDGVVPAELPMLLRPGRVGIAQIARAFGHRLVLVAADSDRPALAVHPDVATDASYGAEAADVRAVCDRLKMRLTLEVRTRGTTTVAQVGRETGLHVKTIDRCLGNSGADRESSLTTTAVLARRLGERVALRPVAHC